MGSSKKTVLVTGAGGFVGHHIVEIFAKQNWRVYALIHNNLPEKIITLQNVKIIQGDITSKSIIPDILKKIGHQPEIVVHAAGLASDVGPDKIYKKLNYESVKTFCMLPTKKFIFISSTDVYGIKDFNGENEESLPYETNPLSPYPKYKIESEKWIKTNLSKDKYVIIRPAAIWGEGDKTIEKRIVNFLSASPFIISFGKWRGKNRWPLTNVKNVAKIIFTAANIDDYNGEAINVIDEKITSIDTYYKNVANKYLSKKNFKSITLPLWLGKAVGMISTTLSNIFRRTTEIFDPTIYSVYHVSHNLDFSCKKQNEILKKYDAQLTKKA